MNILNFFNENDFKIIYYHDYLNILNYKELELLSNNKIIFKYDCIYTVTGDDLKILKLLDNEILIHGKITNIEIR